MISNFKNLSGNRSKRDGKIMSKKEENIRELEREIEELGQKMEGFVGSEEQKALEGKKQLLQLQKEGKVLARAEKELDDLLEVLSTQIELMTR